VEAQKVILLTMVDPLVDSFAFVLAIRALAC